MNGGPSTTTGLGTADSGSETDHQCRIRHAKACLEEAQQPLQHRQTHETNQALRWIKEAIRWLCEEETQKAGEGEQGSEGVHGEDPEEAQVSGFAS